MTESVLFVWPGPALSRFFKLKGRQTPLIMLSPKVHVMLLEFKRLLVFDMKQSDPALLIGVCHSGDSSRTQHGEDLMGQNYSQFCS